MAGDGGFDDTNGQSGARAFAQTHVHVQQRLFAKTLQHFGMSAFL